MSLTRSLLALSRSTPKNNSPTREGRRPRGESALAELERVKHPERMDRIGRGCEFWELYFVGGDPFLLGEVLGEVGGYFFGNLVG